MSTVVTPSRSRRGPGRSWAALPAPGRDVALGLALAAGLCLATFVGGGGTSLAPNTWTQIVLVVVGAALMIWRALSSDRPRDQAGRDWGSAALVLFVGLAVFTALSIAWSVQPADSWVETNRTLSYLAAFGGAMALARIAPARWPAIVGAVATAATVVCGYSLLVKVFPGSLDPGDTFGRLRLPFDYWNAVGLMATLGIGPCLWAGSRREGSLPGRALAVPALAVLVVAVMLSLSRGALVIAVLGLALWFALAQVRLRAVLVLGAGLLGGGVVSAWALANNSITYDRIELSARTHAGHELGLALVVMVLLLAIGGVVLVKAMDRVAVSPQIRRRAGMALIALVVVAALAGVGGVAASSRGLTGTISHAWTQLTSPNSGGASDQPGRLLQVGSTRGRYWNQGLTVGKHAWFKGVGAGGFATARVRYFPPINQYQSFEHAHSYVIETFADLGVIGLVLSLALLVAWALAATRAIVSLKPGRAERDRAGPPLSILTAERDGLIALLVAAVMFGLNSAIDWTWFIPGPALLGLVCAGWLAGRGARAAPAADGGASGPPVFGRVRQPRAGVIAGVVALAAAALVAAWMVYQPLRSANADAAGITAVADGNLTGAINDARSAATYDPVSVDPLFELAALYRSAGNKPAAIAELRKAISLQPQNPQPWIEEGEMLLALHRARQALPALEHAAQLDQGSPQVEADLRAASTQPSATR